MKMKLTLLLALVPLLFASCAGSGFDIFGVNVELVNNRNPNGTFKAVNEVTNTAGETPDSSATVYHYPSGSLGVSAYAGGLLNGKTPKLRGR